jgi:hypothetical protein
MLEEGNDGLAFDIVFFAIDRRSLPGLFGLFHCFLLQGVDVDDGMAVLGKLSLKSQLKVIIFEIMFLKS